MTLDHATAGDLLQAYGRAYTAADGDAMVDLFVEDGESVDETVDRRLVGHNALRARLLEAWQTREQVEFTVERHWVFPPTVIATWHASHVERDTGARVRVEGILLLEVAPDGRITHLREWWGPRSAGAQG